MVQDKLKHNEGTHITMMQPENWVECGVVYLAHMTATTDHNVKIAMNIFEDTSSTRGTSDGLW
jgi:hypothetical protein